MKKEDIIETINTKYRDYEGYVQFSHRPINEEKDIFLKGQKVEVAKEDGFIYEAHFCNGVTSVTIRQLNDGWFISETDISEIAEKDTQEFISDIEDFNRKINMAQVWEEKEDTYCEDMPVKKLQKVVFAGFVGGER